MQVGTRTRGTGAAKRPSVPPKPGRGARERAVNAPQKRKVGRSPLALETARATREHSHHPVNTDLPEDITTSSLPYTKQQFPMLRTTPPASGARTCPSGGHHSSESRCRCCRVTYLSLGSAPLVGLIPRKNTTPHTPSLPLPSLLSSLPSFLPVNVSFRDVFLGSEPRANSGNMCSSSQLPLRDLWYANLDRRSVS